MYESSNRKFSTLSKANNSKSQKCAKSKMPLYNDFELQEDSESELQEFDYTPNVQEIEFKFQRESNPELSELDF
ncbi:26037_t:CDS:2 [Gigaspora rosea]|nr:26037_t:CDS:2 [Gigaspora rosea]